MYIGIIFNLVVCRKILPVRSVYSHFCRRMPLHGKQQSTTTTVRKFMGVGTRACIQVQTYARESKGGALPLVAELSQKVNKAFSQT